ncbi:DAK2 domain-containing protein [Nocardia veterana]|uniref:DAK2 domain-containing protein n=1 Tax=Nocardia veterana TaxID=132249 RepID=UPI000688F338|nr:DAK2 domain-containing protein [Nocardia veterana]
MVTVLEVRETLDAAALRQWGWLCVDRLSAHRDEINSLNVFPVADSDTGTNLLITMRAAMKAVAHEPSTAAPTGGVATLLTAMARAATVGACGNSGIILSQVLRGLAEVAGEPFDAAALRGGLRRAAALVRASLSDPVDGTMLTVLEAAADRAADSPEPTVAAIAAAAAEGAAKALGETPSQLGVLRAAGVVDAGARGLVVLLDALVQVCTGIAPNRPTYGRAGAEDAGRGRTRLVAAPDTGTPLADHDRLASCGETEASGADRAARAGRSAWSQYEVMYLVADTDTARIDALRNALAALGDSVVVVGDGADLWSVHVHCADAGAAVEAGLAAGAVRKIRIEGLVVESPAAAGPADRGILAIASGAGAVRLFEDSGAVVLTGEVTADRLLDAIRAMPQREVLVLPNGALPAPDLVAIGVAARDGRREVLMLPSLSMVQGLAALALHDSGSLAVDDALTMSQSAASTRWGAVRIAAERALTIVGTCEQGDGLGLVGHDVVVIDPDLRRAARTLLDRMLGLGGELVTLLLGAQAPDGLADELTEHITTEFPGVEVVTYDGGQAVDLVQIGVE